MAKLPFSEVKYGKHKNKVPSQFRELGCEPFDLMNPKDTTNPRGKRCLIITGHVSTHDIKAGRLLSEKADRHALGYILDQSKKLAKKFVKTTDDFQFDMVSFNFFKSYHLHSPAHRADATAAMAKRVRSYIAETKPDIILIMGDSANRALLKGDHLNHGLVHKLEVDGKSYPVVPTLDLSSLMMDPELEKGEKFWIAATNMFLYATRTIATLYAGKPIISLKKVKPNCVHVDTVKRFDKLMKIIKEAPAVSVDIETTGLSVLNDDMLTIQFAVDSEVGYLLPWKHKDCPFNSKEMQYIEQELREFFLRKRMAYKRWKKQPYFIMHGGTFDLRFIRKELRVACIQTPVWDTLAGEFILDENLIELRTMSEMKGAFGLEIVGARYNNTYYQTAAFGKSRRTTIKDTDLSEAGDYCAMDVQLPFAIHLAQQRMAEAMEHEGGTYFDSFKRLMLVQMSSMVHQLSSMKLRGYPMDLNYLMRLRGKKSPLLAMMKEEEKKLRGFKSVQRVNKRLLTQAGAPSQGMFGASVGGTAWKFSLSKKDHKQELFINELGLEPVNYGKDGETPAIDKFFQKVHKAVPEVAVLTAISKIKKLYDSYAKGIYNNIKNDPDVRRDQRIRPDFGFMLVTGRTNCVKPNLQQVPEHGDLAKLIKRLFISPEGTLHVKFDFSVHEVRGWGIVALDRVLLKTFNEINALLSEFRGKKTVTDADRAHLKANGDMHKRNYNAFAGVPIEKVTDEERQAAKGITFGSIYGQSAAALADTLGKTKKQAEELIGRFFAKFKKAKDWLNRVADEAISRGYVVSPLGRRRNLWGAIMGFDRLKNAIKRRAQNSPIQGMSSDLAIQAARMLEEEIYNFMLEIDAIPEPTALPSVGVCVMVHDSTEGEAPYRYLFILIWMMEYFAVTGVRKLLLDVYELETHVDFAIEFNIGATGDKMRKWDWRRDNLRDIIRKGLEDQRDVLGFNVDVDHEMKQIYKYAAKYAPLLQKKYPLKHPPFIEGDSWEVVEPKKKKKKDK